MSAPDHEAIAIRLGALGFRVFPLHVVDGKVCRINGWPEKASREAQNINVMFTGREVVGVGIATGDDFTVIDVDVPGDKHEHDGRASLKAAGVELPKTATVRTSSGGEHRIYRTAGGARKTVGGVIHPDAGKLAGVDVRGAGGFVKWHGGDELPDMSKVTDAPAWLPLAGEHAERSAKSGDFLDRLHKIERRNWGANAQHSDAALAIVAEFRKRSPHIGYDELRDDLTHQLAELVTSGAPGAAWAVGACRTVYTTHAPADGDDWGQKFDAALLGLEKLRLPLRVLKTTAEQDRALAARMHGGKGKAGKSKPGRLSDLMGRDFPPLRWVVEDVIPDGCSLLVAAPKIGKSLLALDVALAAATGRDAFGSIPTGTPRPVLYADLESGERRIQARVTMQGWSEFGAFRYHLDARNAVEAVKRFMAKHRGERPLAIIDTLAAVMTDRGDRATLLKHEYDTLKQFQVLTASDPGSAIVIVHHTRKLDSSDPLGMASGTHGTTGAVDHVFVLTRPDRMRPDGTLARLSRDVEDAEFELRLGSDARWHAVGASAAGAQLAHAEREHERNLAKLGPLANALLQIVQADPAATLDVDAILDRYTGASDRDSVGKALRRLADRGHIERVGRGRYTAGIAAVRS